LHVVVAVVASGSRKQEPCTRSLPSRSLSRARTDAMDDLARRARAAAAPLEEWAESRLTKKGRKRFLSAAGPTFLVMTFIEDGLRIFLRWGEQHHYMTKRMGLGQVTGALVLLMSAAVQIGGAALVLRPALIKPSRVKLGSYLLLGFVALQPFMYGQVTDADFMCRSITLAGGFLLLIWAENEKRHESEFTGLPQAESTASADRLQLSGRLLLTFLFLFQAIHGEKGGLHSVLTAPSLFNILSSLLLLALSLMVCVGFHTEWSSLALSVVLLLSAVYMYPFWAVHERLFDYYKYYFFQTLSVIGGLMLLTLHGPGGISLDGQKKAL